MSIEEEPDVSKQVLSDHVHLRIPSLPHWITPTVEFLKLKAIQAGVCHENRSNKLVIALVEAITNSVIHGNLGLSSELKERNDNSFAEALAMRTADQRYASRQVDIEALFDGNSCRWVITDEGSGFDVEAVLKRSESEDPELMLASGRGILMMRSFLDDVHYEMDGRRIVLTMHRSGERRRERRVSLNATLHITPLHDDGSIDPRETRPAVGRNLSRSGVSLLQEELVRAERLMIGILNGDRIVQIPAIVRHSQSLDDGRVEIGCEFTADLSGQQLPTGPAPSPQELADVQSSLARYFELASTLPPHERRTHQRVNYFEKLKVYVDGKAEPIIGCARDLSKSGIAMITRARLSNDCTVEFPAHGPHDLPLSVRARVVRCQAVIDDFYDVGLRFLRLTKTVH